jgi:taurine dioxygenase
MQQTSTMAAARPAPISIRRLGAFLGAEVTDVDLTRALATETVDEIKQAHAEYGVLVFPRQKLSAEDLKRFGRSIGELTVHPFSTSSDDEPELIVYDNKEGNPPPHTDIWHTDETFRECPPMGTMLCSKIIPEVGGDTVFCSMQAAYAGLSDHMQRFIDGLEAIHDFKPFKDFFVDDSEKGKARRRKYEDMYPRAVHPVVRVHPVTGKKVLFVNPSFTVCIKGMDENESHALLDTLYRSIHTLEYQYRHRWVPDTVVFWDNRTVLHAAVHDYYPQRRMLERITIKGDRPVGPVAATASSELRRLKVPWVGDFPNRPKRQHELD